MAGVELRAKGVLGKCWILLPNPSVRQGGRLGCAAIYRRFLVRTGVLAASEIQVPLPARETAPIDEVRGAMSCVVTSPVRVSHYPLRCLSYPARVVMRVRFPVTLGASLRCARRPVLGFRLRFLGEPVSYVFRLLNVTKLTSEFSAQAERPPQG